MTIDASTGADAAALAPVKAVFLDGGGTVTFGLVVAADDAVVRGLAIGNFSSAGIALNSSDNTIEGNFIGTDETGLVAQPNQAEGVFVAAGTGNLIGGTTAAQRNVIAGNTQDGILIFTSSNQVKGNFIGVDRNGAALANGGDGIEVGSGTDFNEIGGGGPGEGNVISANTGDGILLQASDSTTIRGNRIGTDFADSAGLGGGDGIDLQGLAGSDLNQIGGMTAGEGNVISGNAANGIRLTGSSTDNNGIRGNKIGTGANTAVDMGNGLNGIDISEAYTTTIESNVIANSTSKGVRVVLGTGNAIRGNAIRDNNSLGIGLQGLNDNPVLNDSRDGDAGRQRPPELPGDHLRAGERIQRDDQRHAEQRAEHPVHARGIQEQLAAIPRATGEGATALGSYVVQTDGSGNASIVNVPVLVADRRRRRDHGNRHDDQWSDTGSTSEFSACETAVAAPPPGARRITAAARGERQRSPAASGRRQDG